MRLQMSDFSDEEIKILNGFIKDIEILRMSPNSRAELNDCTSLGELSNIVPFNRIKNILLYLYDNAEMFNSLVNNESDNLELSLSNSSWLEFRNGLGTVYLLKNGDEVNIIEKIKSPLGDFHFGFYYCINLSDYSKPYFDESIAYYIRAQSNHQKPISEETAFILAISDTLLPEDAESVIVNDSEEIISQWANQWRLLSRDYKINK